MEQRSFLHFLNPLSLFGLLIKQRDLVWQLTRRNIAQEVKGSYLGILWTLLNPLLELAVYAVVFGLIFGARFEESPNPGKVDYVLGLFLGLTLYSLIADMLGIAPRLILGNPNYVKKVVFPLEVLPASATGAAIYRFLVTLALLLIGTFFIGEGLTWKALLFPVVAFPVVLIALGFTFFASSLGVFFRDLAQITNVLSKILLYASGVFYAAIKVKEHAPGIWTWLQWNPILLSIESCRRVLLWDLSPDPWHVAYSWIFGLVLCLIGYACFEKLRPSFADVL
ncbi:ABC transporter permease [Rubellicoccus peritrichatus]|uniref:Transport permease protein n=1 Tax=Rubellicoccus peritrichatus TaxID=3080537 RepID=A0AAQ3L5M4_9BACT|nr:ABC transporter permease [Puniceicoccus sp. CR14]WOO39461.1 ABC transporter permease [Puniceicoccus sp. CR14]